MHNNGAPKIIPGDHEKISQCEALLFVAASLQQWQRKININLENIAISSLYRYTFMPYSFH